MHGVQVKGAGGIRGIDQHKIAVRITGMIGGDRMPGAKTTSGTVADGVITVCRTISRCIHVGSSSSGEWLAGIRSVAKGDVYDRITQAALAKLGIRRVGDKQDGNGYDIGTEKRSHRLRQPKTI